jgi:hypothetical protein
MKNNTIPVWKPNKNGRRKNGNLLRVAYVYLWAQRQVKKKKNRRNIKSKGILLLVRIFIGTVLKKSSLSNPFTEHINNVL